MKLIYCLTILICPLVSRCQSVKPITVGDNVPDITITNMLNSGVSSSGIAAYKGKILILDFMSTGCVPCIRVLPLLDSLQMKFQSRIQIILVTAEAPQRVQSFLKMNPELKLPIVAADSTLAKLFPHVYISHIAWIGPSGIVRGITHSEYINTKNIDALLQGQKVKWPVKRDVTTFDYKQTLFSINENNIPEFSLPSREFYTAFTNYMPGIQKYNDISEDSARHVLHVSFINRSIIELYLLLYQHFHLPLSQVSAGVKAWNRLVYNPADGYYDDWMDKNFYCMDALIPEGTPWPLLQKKLVSDCNFFLGLQGKMEKRLVDCLVLKNKNASINKKAGKGNGLRVGMITYLLNNVLGNVPVIDETTGTTYLTIPIPEQKVKEGPYLSKALAQYGLELVPEKRELEFLVITEP